MDMTFSSDDSLLVTASGDQTAMVIDMQTRKNIFCLANHSSSVKEVHFQPGSGDNVIATCSRDGMVSMWDLRCKGIERPSLQLRCSLDLDADQYTPQHGLKYPQIFNCIRNAHKFDSDKNRSLADVEGSSDRKNSVRFNEVSVTSMTFLPPGREHLLATGCESNACVKLWDIRANYNHRLRRAQPLSTTREPESHRSHRQFGLTSLTTNGDGSRLYTVCRDSTVYAYSTSHLILGNAPEMSASASHPRTSVAGQDKDGLGPIYGFRHPRLQVATFYIKAAVRKANGNQGELLAVGSSNQCPVLFPTDERLLKILPSRNSNKVASQGGQRDSSLENLGPATVTMKSGNHVTRPCLRRISSGLGRSSRRIDTIPIYEQGTALLEGHRKEVSSVTWTRDGELVTVSDDYHARCWREGEQAAELRREGNDNGRKWRCGWADVDAGCDEDDGDIIMTDDGDA